MNLNIGCCGFRSAREKYYEAFSVVEVQHTFYNPPKIETLKRWRTEAPPGFEFTLKAYQLITHEGDSPTYHRLKKQPAKEMLEECGSFRPTQTVADAFRTTLNCAIALNASMILFQCPSRFRPEEENIENLRRFFKSALSLKPEGIRFAWEPRGEWPEALIGELCEELSLVHAVDPFKGTSLTPALRYYRLHGRGRANQRYTNSELCELSDAIESNIETYVMFNNVFMLQDAETFRKIRANTQKKVKGHKSF